ncbi:hypothetical protein ACET3Z_031249 [Daucus carota]
MLNFQKSLAENAALKLTESKFPVSETAENLIFHFQKLGVKSASQKLKTTPFVCNAVQELRLEPLRKKAEEELRELKLERHKEVLCKLEEQKTLIEALKDDVDALK